MFQILAWITGGNIKLKTPINAAIANENRRKRI